MYPLENGQGGSDGRANLLDEPLLRARHTAATAHAHAHAHAHSHAQAQSVPPPPTTSVASTAHFTTMSEGVNFDLGGGGESFGQRKMSKRAKNNNNNGAPKKPVVVPPPTLRPQHVYAPVAPLGMLTMGMFSKGNKEDERKKLAYGGKVYREWVDEWNEMIMQ